VATANLWDNPSPGGSEGHIVLSIWLRSADPRFILVMTEGLEDRTLAVQALSVTVPGSATANTGVGPRTIFVSLAVADWREHWKALPDAGRPNSSIRLVEFLVV